MRFAITDNTDQNHMTAAAFKRAVKIAGLTLADFGPAAVPTADWTPASVEKIADAAFNVAAAGGDPAADPQVQALLTSRLPANTIGGLYHRNQVQLSKGDSGTTRPTLQPSSKSSPQHSMTPWKP